MLELQVPSFGVAQVLLVLGGYYMSDTYVVGFHSTEHSSRAVEYAANLAKKSGAQLHLVQVIEWSPYSFHTPEELAERHGRREQELSRALAMTCNEINEAGKRSAKSVA